MTKHETDKKKYEKPIIVPLGELAVSMGAGCSDGSSAFGSCGNGSTADPSCNNGGVAQASCGSGGDPKTSCNSGVSADNGCNTGCSLSGLSEYCSIGSSGCPVR